VFGRAIAVKDYGDIWFRNSGQTGGTIEHPGQFKDNEERDAFLEAWRLSTTGANRHKDRLLTHGVRYNPLKVTNAEAQLLDTEKSSDVQVFGLWNFPPHRAARLDRATFSNIEQQSIDYVTHTIGPPVVAIEQAIERDLLVGEDQADLFAEFNVAGLLRGDILSRYRAYAIGRQWGWLSVNDVRRKENDNSIGPAGDEYLTPTNMVPAGTLPSPADDKPDDDAKDKPEDDSNAS
jgi:HK97 family phage portal protein